MTRNEESAIPEFPNKLLIGNWRPAANGGTFSVENPATGREIATIADAEQSDALAALDAADKAAPAWASVPARQRSEILRRTYELIIDRTEDFARLITAEMGKPIFEARAEVAYGSDYVRWYAEEAVRLNGRHATSPDGGSRILTKLEPVGVCLLVTPWNFPLAMGTRKIAPALAAGCTVVLKPAAATPLTSLLLGDVLLEAGVPEGVVNIVTTTDPRGTFEPLLLDPRSRKLSFTGSTAVGSLLAQQGAKQMLRTSMELGGNAPFIVFDDADLDLAVEGAILAKLRNSGQSCVAANRIFVQEGIADRFVERFTAAMGDAPVGPGTEPEVRVGPLIDTHAADKTAGLVTEALGSGARVLVGGEPVEGPGSFFPPTVLDGVPGDARILKEEVFAPVAPIVRFRDEADAITQANSTPYGLVAYAFTQNLERALRVNDRLQVGMVGINRGLVSNVAAPFGGIKLSGIGREGGSEGILEYVSHKYTAIDSRNGDD